jgi:hypothetical protein
VHAARLRLRSHDDYEEQGSVFGEPRQLHCLPAVTFTLTTVLVVHDVCHI